MNSRKFLILFVPGLALLLLFSLRNVGASASMSAPAAPDAAGNAILTITVMYTPEPVALPEPGGTVLFTIKIDNQGVDDVLIVEIMSNVYDDLRDENNPKVAANTCPTVALDPIVAGGQAQCSFEAQVTGPPGAYINSITVVVEHPSEPQENLEASATVTIDDVPSSIVTTLTAVPTSVPEPGGNVAFTARVENTSAVDTVDIETLSGTAPLGDLVGRGTCTGFPRTLGVGDSFQCSVTVFVPGAPGQEKDIAVTAEGTDDDGFAVADSSDPVKITITDVPSSIVTTLSAAPTSVSEPGGNVAFTVNVQNTSAVDTVTISTLNGTSSLGNLIGKGTCTSFPRTLAAGASFQCSANAPVSGTPGQVKNFTVTAAGTDDDGAAVADSSNTVQITITNVPSSIATTLSAVPTSVPEPGGDVTFTARVENTSAVDTVTISTLMGSPPLNNLIDKGTCTSFPRTLTAGASFECSVTVTVSGTPGQEKNFTVTATGTDDDGGTVTDSSNTVKITITDVPSSIVTTLSAVPTSVPEPGGNVTFTIRIDNTSAVDAVTINTLTGDTPLNNLNGKGTCTVPQAIAAGAFYQCAAAVMVSGTAGQEKNFAIIAAGTDDDGAPVTDSSDPIKITVTSPDITRIFLPLVLGNHTAGEPNNTCAQAPTISINSDHFFLPDDKEDWYRFNLTSPGNLVVELSNFVPVQGQIIVYRGNCNGLQFLKNNGNFSTTKIVDVGPVAPGTFFVRVITDGPFSTTLYKLRVRFP